MSPIAVQLIHWWHTTIVSLEGLLLHGKGQIPSELVFLAELLQVWILLHHLLVIFLIGEEDYLSITVPREPTCARICHEAFLFLGSVGFGWGWHDAISHLLEIDLVLVCDGLRCHQRVLHDVAITLLARRVGSGVDLLSIAFKVLIVPSQSARFLIMV